MSRTKYFDFRSEDSTALLNNRLRGILDAGVYRGFQVSSGSSGGLWLKFTHEADPDNSGSLLGVLITPDGVILQENANQDNVVQGSISAGVPNIHYLIASYTYNASLPNNDVTYFIRQGTTGSPPTPPSLTDDEVLIAEIYMPGGSSAYIDSGVIIKNISKKNVYNVPNVISDQLSDVLKPGIYDGMIPSVGSSDLDVTLSSGTWITQENRRIIESSNLTDFDTLTNPGDGYYRFAWIIGMHKDEDSDPIADVDYMLVEGSPALITAEATLPSNSEILTAAQTVRAEYTDNSYINKLGYIRCENNGGTYIINYFRGETFLDHESLIVYSGEANSSSRSGKYFGHDGLVQAINDVYSLSKTQSDLNKPYVIHLDGGFKLSGSTLYLPSNVILEGSGAGAKLSSEENDVVHLGGYLVEYSSSASINYVGAGSGTPPSGYVAKEIEITSSYRSGDDLIDRLLSAGDIIYIYDNTGTTLYKAIFYSYATGTSNWSINVFVETQYQTDGHPLNCDLVILKRNNGLKNLEVGRISSTNGNLNLSYAEHCLLDNVTTRDFTFSLNRRCYIDKLTITNDPTFTPKSIGSGSNLIESYGNKINSIYLTKSTSSILGLFNGFKGYVDLFVYDNPKNTINLYFSGGSFGLIDLRSSLSSKAFLEVGLNSVGTVLGDLEVTGNDINVGFAYGDVTMSSLITGSKVHHIYGSGYPEYEFDEFVNQDRNLLIHSTANITYNSSTELLAWDADIKFDLPTINNGTATLASGNVTINASNDYIYFYLDRGSSSSITLSSTTKSVASNLAKNNNLVVFARLYDSAVYLWNGTRLENGHSVKIDGRPPTFDSTSDGLVPASGGGTSNFLRADGSWDTPAGSVSPLNTKGDLYTYDTDDARLPVGTTDGEFLKVNSSTSTGLEWGAVPSVSNSNAGLAPQLSGDANDYLSGDGTWSDPIAVRNSHIHVYSSATGWSTTNTTYGVASEDYTYYVIPPSEDPDYWYLFVNIYATSSEVCYCQLEITDGTNTDSHEFSTTSTSSVDIGATIGLTVDSGKSLTVSMDLKTSGGTAYCNFWSVHSRTAAYCKRNP